MKEPNIEKAIQRWITDQPEIHFAILFGSFAKKNTHPNSDIDLAIELDQPITSDIKLSLLQSLGEITNKTIDLIDLKKVGEPLLNEIIQSGKVLKGNNNKFIELSIKNINMMEDFTPYIQRTLNERRERLLNE
jgi:predicted nucleotidyltransferase